MDLDGLKLDKGNKKFFSAIEFIKDTNRSVFLTGKAGTGKTTFLKYLKTISLKNSVVLAPTGIAAINAGGQTIHSFFQIKPSLYVPGDKRLRKKAPNNAEDRSTIYDHFRYRKEKLKIIQALEVLIIDEISMVRCDLLDVVDRLLQVFRKKIGIPFGGVQVIFIGDAYQLPPITKDNEWEILSQFYNTPYFFSAKSFKKVKPECIQLDKIYRQSDPNFIQLLNKVREGKLENSDLDELNNRYIANFTPPEGENYITLATHNYQVDAVNELKLKKLKTKKRTYIGKVDGRFKRKDMATDFELDLKVEAQVMFVKNDSGVDRRYYNGKIGKVEELNANSVIVSTDEHDRIVVEKATWENVEYTWNKEKQEIEEKVLGTFSQLPLKLAWAITVHKSQGLTFDKVIADVSSAFDYGQVYVALSRCTSLDGLVLKNRIDGPEIKTDYKVITFSEKNDLSFQEINDNLTAAKADSAYEETRKAIRSNNIDRAIEKFCEANSFRSDINTQVFRRILKLYISRYYIHKDDLYKVDLSESNLYRGLYKYALEENEVLNKEVKELKRKLKISKNSNSLAQKKQDKLEKNKEKLSNKIDEMEESYKTIQKELSRYKNKVKKFESLRWYQKIFY